MVENLPWLLWDKHLCTSLAFLRLVEIKFFPPLSVPFLQACRDFLDLAETHSRRWQRALQYEREQRTHLEETIEQLAKQHNSLERAWREAPTLASSTPSANTTTKGEFESKCSFCADFTFLAKVMCVTSGWTSWMFLVWKRSKVLNWINVACYHTYNNYCSIDLKYDMRIV